MTDLEFIKRLVSKHALKYVKKEMIIVLGTGSTAGIFIEELFLLKLISLFLNLNLDIIFFVCLVSSHAIKETFSKMFSALGERSFKFPIGVPTIYKTPLSGSEFI